jgi:CHAT domain-containing protein
MKCLECPTKTDILAGLPKSDLSNFAGHGISHPVDPLKSCLALRDWRENPLTVENLLSLEGRQQKPPFLAYLSACSTAHKMSRST